ncbi:iron uptake transporter permease EfeU [uncultured Jatrophihabitans sp.]|uniref:iron uptake transporter permease EfeU n=1 Tax=uncultured Jatrophihabitans sp. TaxID=1610747 RepID=UPI0035CAF046
MLPTFVIGLREGLEAALIVGIIAAFLRKQGRRDLLRWVLAGVGVAVLLCVGAGVALEVYSQNLPQKQQEGLETVIGALAVGMVTYMVVWMRRNSRHLKGQLEGLAADALAGGPRAGAGVAMVLMAFLAVIREGLETVVFLLAAFNESGSSGAAGFGAVLGIAVAVVLGYGIYRGGVRLNLSKFFRATGLVLVLVAAGLVVNALHTAHEAGWLDAGQGATVDLSWLAEPGSVRASLLTGMLGIQSRPVVVEVVGWLVYLVPVGLFVAWPPGKAAPARLLARAGGVVAALAAAAALTLTLSTPARPASRPVTTAGAISAQVVGRSAQGVEVRTQSQQPVGGVVGASTTYALSGQGSQRRGGVDTEAYRGQAAEALAASSNPARPARLTVAQIAALNGGRLPIGLSPSAGSLPATYRAARTLTVWVDPRTDRVVDLGWSEQVSVSVRDAAGVFALDEPLGTATTRLPAAAVRLSAAAATAAGATLDNRARLHTLAVWCAAFALVALLVAAAFALVLRRRERPMSAVLNATPELVRG